MSNSGEYVCTLDKASLKKAKDELGENPKDREEAVQALRKWVEDNHTWLKSPTDARKKLVKFWTARTRNKAWFENIDTKDPKIIEALKQGNVLILPERDDEGQGIWILRPGAIDTTGKITFDDVMRSTLALIDWSLFDENKIVNGTLVFQDCTNLTLKHQTMFGVENIKKSMDSWLNGFTARYKGVHYYNSNPVFDVIFLLVQPLMPEKLRKRLHFHGKNLSSVYKHISHKYLPEDYRPDDTKGKSIGTIQDCIDKQIKALHEPEVRDYILKFSSAGYGVKEELKPKDEELFSESFRKLNID